MRKIFEKRSENPGNDSSSHGQREFLSRPLGPFGEMREQDVHKRSNILVARETHRRVGPAEDLFSHVKIFIRQIQGGKIYEWLVQKDAKTTRCYMLLS